MTAPQSLFRESFDSNTRQTNRIVQWLLLCQWAFVVVLSLLVTPGTWIAETGRLNVHIAGAIAGAGLLALGPWALIRVAPTAAGTRYVVATAQMLFSAVIIHMTGGRIESHFHIFGSLAILAFYRDWKVIAVATAVTGVDHILRGLFLPQSIYGLTSPQLLRSFVHIGWVVFEDVFLLMGVSNQVRRMVDIAETKADREAVQRRTDELFAQTLDQLNTGSELTTSTEQALNTLRRVRKALDNLVSTEHVVDEANRNINRAAEHTGRQMESLSNQANDQASHVTESSAAVEEMVANLSSVNQIVQKQNDNIDTVTRDVTRAQEDANLLSSTVDRLGHAGEQIHEMVSVIANVASQTQLLAMNAAIEAAHAGDAGRGFSVVAGEIRKLSEQTSAEVNEIHDQVETITSSIEEARGAVERTAGSYRSAAEGFSNVRHAFSQIASANQELTQGGNEVLQAISALREITNAVRDLSEDTRATQGEVTQAAQQLDGARTTLGSVTAEITESMDAIAEAIQEAADVAVILEDQLETVASQREGA